MPRDARRRVICYASQPGELAAVEQHLFFDQGINGGHSRKRSKGQAVLGSYIIDVLGRTQAARTCHGLRNDRRISGDMLADVLSENACVKVVTAADAETDDEVDILPTVEFGDVVGARGRQRSREYQDREEPQLSSEELFAVSSRLCQNSGDQKRNSAPRLRP